MSEEKNMTRMLGDILNSTTGPAPSGSPFAPGCKPVMMRGMMKMKKGTVTAAMMEYAEESVARFSSVSTAERSEKYAP
jgi:hypothetical protein